MQHTRAGREGNQYSLVAAGMGADVMAGGSGAAGPAPYVRYQPPGNRTYPHKNLHILVYPYQNRDIPFYDLFSDQNMEYLGISQDIPG